MTENNQLLVSAMLAQVHRFNADIIGLPIPSTPARLSEARKDWAHMALTEELTEFQEANTLEDEADALIDLSYFALGRLIEMGLLPGPLFETVHAANMAKQRGQLSKRPNSLGFDAVKPEGWKPPNLAPFLTLGSQHVQHLVEEPVDITHGLKVLVLGNARHGKDTVCEILRDEYGLSFQGSSLFCAEKVIWTLLHDDEQAEAFVNAFPEDDREALMTERNLMRATYRSTEHCFEDRGVHRAFWYKALSWFNDRPTRLAEAIFAEYDVYAGIRNKRELHGVLNAGLADLVVWVDASDRLPPEDASSISIEPWMADFVIDNNGSLEELKQNVQTLMDRVAQEY